MTGLEPFSLLIARLGANRGAPVVISAAELSCWPEATLTLLKINGLLVKTRPAVSTLCSGCERECVMPVHVVPTQSATPVAFVVCDKRDDINRVAVPLANLDQWQTSVNAVADLLAVLLDLHRPLNRRTQAEAWHLGLLRGPKHAGYVKLLVDGELTVSLGGHFLPLADLLELRGNQFIVDRRRVSRALNNPTEGNADIESAADRRTRIKRRVQALKMQGVKDFLKKVAAEESISLTRVKQLLTATPVSPKKKTK